MIDARFPELTPKQVETLKLYGSVETFESRTQIFKSGELNYDFFVVLDGHVDIEDPSNQNSNLVTHHKNQFTGDSGMLSTRGSQFNAFALPGTTVLRIAPKRLKEAIAQQSDISDVLMHFYYARKSS